MSKIFNICPKLALTMTSMEYLVSEPHDLSQDLTRWDRLALEDLFYSRDLNFGADIQPRAAGALIQQLIAAASGVIDHATPNKQLQSLRHFGGVLHTYIEKTVGVKIRAHDIRLRELNDGNTDERDRHFYAEIKKPEKKGLSAVDFPNSIFPANGPITSGKNKKEIRRENIMLELKCHFPTSEEASSIMGSDAAAIADFKKDLKAAANNKSEALKFRFMSLILIFAMVPAPPPKKRPFELKSVSARWVMYNSGLAMERTFKNHVEAHEYISITDEGLAPGIVKVKWKDGTTSIHKADSLGLSARELKAVLPAKRRRRDP